MAFVVLATAAALIALTAGSSSRAATAHTLSPATGKVGVQPEVLGPFTQTGASDLFSCQPNPIDGSAGGPRCYAPQQIQQAYGLSGLLASGVTGAGRTIVIVDAFQNPYITHDLALEDAVFGLSAPPSFTIIAPQGVPAFDPNNDDMVGWGEETSLDVEWAHVMAPGAKIVLVEAASDYDSDLYAAEKYAVDNHLGDVMSQSFGENESCVDPSVFSNWQNLFHQATSQGWSVFASSGDSGASQFNCDGTAAALAPGFPASDPDVTGVGGTTLNATDPDGNYVGETAWTEQFYGCNPPALAYPFDINCSGGGYSTIFSRPDYQQALVSGGSGRGVPDVSYDAGVNGGVLTVCSVCDGGAPAVYLFGGTSAGSPQWAALTADADQIAGHDLGAINPFLYLVGETSGYSADFHDITTGNNDVYEIGKKGYKTGKGWDAVTGLGTPNAANLLPELASGCLTGSINGPTTIGSGEVLCAAPGFTFNGPVTVNGGTLILNGAAVHGPLTTSGASSVTICGSTISGPLSVSGTSGLTLVGGTNCAGNTISGPASFTNNGAVQFNNNTVSGPLTFTHNGSVQQSGNHVSGPTKTS